MSVHVELMTEKYLQTAEPDRAQQIEGDDAAAMPSESPQSAPAATGAVSLDGLMSKGIPVLLLLVLVGWLLTNRDTLSVFSQPGSPERKADALLWMSGADHRFEDTKLGRMAGKGQPFDFELPEAMPVGPVSDRYPGLFGNQEHDDWYRALPSERNE